MFYKIAMFIIISVAGGTGCYWIVELYKKIGLISSAAKFTLFSSCSWVGFLTVIVYVCRKVAKELKGSPKRNR